MDNICCCCLTHSDVLRAGWPSRRGGSVMLCNPCASIYEQGTICDIFHRDDSGWRKCIICDKKLHCGCIMSVHTFTELDLGGVKCIECISNEESMGPMSRDAPPHPLEDLQEPLEVLCVDSSQMIIVKYESTEGVSSQGAHFENPGDSEEPQGVAPGIYRRHLYQVRRSLVKSRETQILLWFLCLRKFLPRVMQTPRMHDLLYPENVLRLFYQNFPSQKVFQLQSRTQVERTGNCTTAFGPIKAQFTYWKG